MNGAEDAAERGRRIAWWRSVPVLFLLLPLALDTELPQLALALFLLLTVGMALVCFHWYRVRDRRQLIVADVLNEDDLALRKSEERQTTARVSAVEKALFVRLGSGFAIVASLATANTLLIVLGRFEDVWLPTRYVRACTPRGAVVISLVLYAGAVGFFIALRVFVDNRNLIAYRDSTKASAGGIDLVVDVLMLTRKHDHAGETWARTAIFAMVYVLLVPALALASPNLKSGILPGRADASSSSSEQGKSGTPKVTTKPKPVQTTDGNSANNNGSSGVTTASSSSTTQPPVQPALSCDGVRSMLIADLPIVVNMRVAFEYSNHYRDLSCVVLGENGRIASHPWGDMTAVDFALRNGAMATGSIVFDKVGDATTVLSNESTFADATKDDADVRNITRLIGIHGAQLRLALHDDGRCIVEMRPDGEADWSVYAPDVAAAVLVVFLAEAQVGRPITASRLRFAYPTPDVTIRSDAAGHVVIEGVVPTLAQAARAADSCVSLDTLQTADLDGAPGP